MYIYIIYDVDVNMCVKIFYKNIKNHNGLLQGDVVNYEKYDMFCVCVYF